MKSLMSPKGKYIILFSLFAVSTVDQQGFDHDLTVGDINMRFFRSDLLK